jgi:hypothetical protein
MTVTRFEAVLSFHGCNRTLVGCTFDSVPTVAALYQRRQSLHCDIASVKYLRYSKAGLIFDVTVHELDTSHEEI